MAVRAIPVRWRGRCRLCRAELRVGQTAYFDEVARDLTCTTCATRGNPQAAAAAPPPRPSPRRSPADADPDEVRRRIAEARAALAAARRAS